MSIRIFKIIISPEKTKSLVVANDLIRKLEIEGNAIEQVMKIKYLYDSIWMNRNIGKKLKATFTKQ